MMVALCHFVQAALNKFAGCRGGEVPIMMLRNPRGGQSTIIPPDIPLAQTSAASCGPRVCKMLPVPELFLPSVSHSHTYSSMII